ncbi:MAG: thiamine-monophosphate kinase [Thermoleophilaceae bacterium]|nr:thiamine-monophosphate kinase [Thermoleophilaceae bacterium]
MSELSLIARVKEMLGEPGGRVLTGPGDDAAVVRAEGVCATSIDTVVDGVHFELATHSPADVGHKALATALSDIAAMGAEPGEAYVSLALPGGLGEDAALELVEAMRALARRTGTTIAGGDVVGGPALYVSVAVTGWAPSAGALVYRRGARPGDLVGVTGELGASGAGLLVLRGKAQSPEGDRLIARHRRPEPRLEEGRALAAAGASAMIDVSDGVATDARHLANASGVELELRLAGLPVAPGVADVTGDPRRFAATAGDDYELLFTLPPERRAEVEAALPVSWLGGVRAGAGLVFVGDDGRVAQLEGFEHVG